MKKHNQSFTDQLGENFAEDLEEIRTQGLTHKLWAAKRKATIKYPKSPSELASFLRYEVS